MLLRKTSKQAGARGKSQAGGPGFPVQVFAEEHGPQFPVHAENHRLYPVTPKPNARYTTCSAYEFCVCVRICMYVYTYMYLFIYLHVYTYIYIYTLHVYALISCVGS